MSKKTQVYQYHAKHGNIVEYAGYDLPVWYEGITAECKQVREHAGVFDVSHMGRVIVEGAGAAKFLDQVTTNDVSGLGVNKGQYSLLCNLRGGIIDDLTVFRLGASRYLIVYNAANREKNWNWLLKKQDHYNVQLKDVSETVAMFAVQGTRARDILRALSGTDLENIERYSASEAKVDDIPVLITRTGYTGEDGFEIYIWDTTPDKPDKAMHVWNKIIDRGRQVGLHAVGLGARDVLRLEAGMCLYGNDIDEKTTPVQARLMFVTRLEKPDFIGKKPIEQEREKGPSRIRIGFKIVGKGIPRKGQEILSDAQEVGLVTSGTLSPTLGESVGMGFVRPQYAKIGEKLSVRIRDRVVPAVVVKLPFYQRRSDNRVIVYGTEIGLADFRRRGGQRQTVAV